MAELPGILPGPFPDGIFGFRGLRRNRGIIAQSAERILGDDAAVAVLEQTGQLASVEALVDQGLRASTRAEQRPVITALAQIADGMQLFEQDRFLVSEYDRSFNESALAAAQFAGPEQREEILQLMEAEARAVQQAQYSPSEGLDNLTSLGARLLEITKTAGDRIESEWLGPLREFEFEVRGVEQQLIDASEGNMQEMATPQEVLQVMELLNTQTSQEYGGFSASLPFLGGLSPDDVPNMTYAELLNELRSNLKGKAEFVRSELERRGAPMIAAAEQRLLPTQRQSERDTRETVTDALKEAYGPPAPNETRERGVQASDAIERWFEPLRQQGARLDVEAKQAVLPDGTRINPPPSARALMEQTRRQRAGRQAPQPRRNWGPINR